MENKVTIQELVAALAVKKGISKKDAELFVRTVFDIVAAHLKEEKSVKIKGFGTFKLVEIESRESINVNTGERILLNGYTKVSFTPDADMRDAVNKPFSQFETVILNEGTKTEDMERVFEPEVENTVEMNEEDITPELQEPAEAIKTEEVHEVIAEESVAEDSPMDTQTDKAAEVATEPSTDKTEPELITEEECKTENVIASNKEVQPVKKDRNVYKIILALIIVFASLIAYYLYLNPEKTTVVTNVTTTEVIAEVMTDSINKISNDTIAADSADIKDTLIVEETTYPQLEGGEFVIVGTKTEHTLKKGETLRTISLKYYGTKENSDYIVVYNQIEKPDLVPVGITLKIPELKTK